MAIEPESVALGSKVIGSCHLLGVGVVWGHSTIRVKHQQRISLSLSLALSNDHRDLDGVSALTETSLLLCISVVRGDGPRRFGDNQTSLGQTDSRDDGCTIQTMATIQAIVGLSLSLSLAIITVMRDTITIEWQGVGLDSQVSSFSQFDRVGFVWDHCSIRVLHSLPSGGMGVNQEQASISFRGSASSGNAGKNSNKGLHFECWFSCLQKL